MKRFIRRCLASLVILIICFSPTMLYLSLSRLVTHEGYWQIFATVGVVNVLLSGLQILLIVVATFLLVAVWKWEGWPD